MDVDPRDYDDPRGPRDSRDGEERDPGHDDDALWRARSDNSIRCTVHWHCRRAAEGARPNDLTGTEDIGPEDTLDGEYRRLVERAYSVGNHVKGLASPTRQPTLYLEGPVAA
jgi:hypothetical protein